MIDINLIPDAPATAAANPAARWPTVALTLGGALVAVLLVLNAYFWLTVIPTLENRIEAATLRLSEREKAIALLTREESALVARRERVAAAKSAYAGRPLWTPLLAQARDAVVKADALLGRDGAVWLSAVEAGDNTLRLNGFVAGPGAHIAVAAIADALKAAGSDATVDVTEPAENGQKRFQITATVTQ